MADIVEKLAAGIHEDWRQGPWSKKPHLDVPYDQLAPADQEANRAAARRMADVLAQAGLGLTTAEQAAANTPAADEIASSMEAHMERLAEAEHDGWMAQRAKDGWRYGSPRDDARKLHPSMVPYRDLPDSEKEKDRAAVRNYPKQAAAAGLVIVRQ
jgi:RyR domain-containing protein